MIKFKPIPRLESDIGLYTLVVAILFIIASIFCSCKTLQSTKGYENYPRNYDWKTNKL